MSRQCPRCGENVFDSKAYLEMSMFEQKQMDKVIELREKIKSMEKDNVDINFLTQAQHDLKRELEKWETIIKCKNMLYK